MRTFYLKCLLLALLPAAPLCLPAQTAMTNERLEEILRREASNIEGEGGSWILFYEGRLLMVLTDGANNRLRAFTPITDERQLLPSDLQKMLAANFQSALDAKYALYDGFVVSVFTHPFAELTEGQLLDALRQIVRLADTFGSSFSSTDLPSGQPAAEGEKRINQRPGPRKQGN